MRKNLDEILEDLDDRWSRDGTCELTDLIKLIQPPHKVEDIAELCVADFEWRWRSFSSHSTQSATSPSIEEYREHLGTGWGDQACRRILLQAEWLVRSVWGDKPRIDGFVSKNDCTEETTTELVESLNLAVPLDIELQLQDQKSLTIAAPASFSIGRQRINEPPAPYWDSSNNRLVAWPIDLVGISRDQLKIKRTRAEELEVTNVSSNRRLCIHGRDLQPNQADHFDIPFWFELKSTVITVRPADLLSEF